MQGSRQRTRKTCASKPKRLEAKTLVERLVNAQPRCWLCDCQVLFGRIVSIQTSSIVSSVVGNSSAHSLCHSAYRFVCVLLHFTNRRVPLPAATFAHPLLFAICTCCVACESMIIFLAGVCWPGAKGSQGCWILMGAIAATMLCWHIGCCSGQARVTFAHTRGWLQNRSDMILRNELRRI